MIDMHECMIIFDNSCFCRHNNEHLPPSDSIVHMGVWMMFTRKSFVEISVMMMMMMMMMMTHEIDA